MKSSNASASAFGWDFQSNAAIMLMLKNMERASKVKVEGQTEDVEITLADGKILMSQVKAVATPDDTSHVKEKLEAGLRTLNNAVKLSNVKQLVFITNSPNPFNDATTMFKFSIQQFDSEITRINVDAIAIQKIIDKLEKERRSFEERVIKSVKQDNPLIGELHQLISSYAVRLGLDDKYVSARNDYIFTNGLKSLSGAIFHKVVFAFKISYVKLIQQHTGVCLPIILDSPSGREVSLENINEMMAILAENSTDHQIIIASIYNSYSFPNKNIIELTDRLLSF